MPIALHQGTVGLDPGRLVPGSDLVLDLAPEHGILAPLGVAIGDHLGIPERVQIDREAFSTHAAWQARRTNDLRVDGLDLAWLLELELVADCFLPAARLERALASGGPFVAKGLSAGFVAMAQEAGHEMSESTTGGGTASARPQARASIPARLVATTGVPARPRGRVIPLPYWHLAPVLAALASSDPGLLTASGVGVPGLPSSDALAVALRGGWLGHPGRRERERAVRDVESALDALTPLDARDAMALQLLRERAPRCLAGARRARRALRDRARLVLLPWDSPPEGRLLLAEARAAGRTALVVQHGFDAGLNDPDKTSADHVALWSEQDVTRSDRQEGLTVTGNPGAEHIAARPVRAGLGGPTVVLVDYPSRLSAQIDARVAMRHVSVALEGIAAANDHRDVVIRPHPADPYPESYLTLAATHPKLKVRIDARTPIEPLLAQASLCIGALSTATLQAGALGVPTVHLDVTGLVRPWPFDGTIPLARTSAELAEAVLEPFDSIDASREALGVRAGAVEAVCALVRSLSAG